MNASYLYSSPLWYETIWDLVQNGSICKGEGGVTIFQHHYGQFTGFGVLPSTFRR